MRFRARLPTYAGTCPPSPAAVPLMTSPVRVEARCMILFENVTKTYPRTTRPALDDVSLEIPRGEFAFVVGTSGSGKSTMMQLVMKEQDVSRGRILVAGRDLDRLPERKVPALRREIGCVFQDFRLLPNKTVFQNVAYARAFVNRPPVLLADEPTGNLDPDTSLGIVQLLDRINRTGTTVVMATHDTVTVDAMRKRVIRLDHGVLVSDLEAGDYETGSIPRIRLDEDAEAPRRAA